MVLFTVSSYLVRVLTNKVWFYSQSWVYGRARRLGKAQASPVQAIVLSAASLVLRRSRRLAIVDSRPKGARLVVGGPGHAYKICWPAAFLRTVAIASSGSDAKRNYRRGTHSTWHGG